MHLSVPRWRSARHAPPRPRRHAAARPAALRPARPAAHLPLERLLRRPAVPRDHTVGKNRHTPVQVGVELLKQVGVAGCFVYGESGGPLPSMPQRGWSGRTISWTECGEFIPFTSLIKQIILILININDLLVGLWLVWDKKIRGHKCPLP